MTAILILAALLLDAIDLQDASLIRVEEFRDRVLDGRTAIREQSLSAVFLRRYTDHRLKPSDREKDWEERKQFLERVHAKRLTVSRRSPQIAHAAHEEGLKNLKKELDWKYTPVKTEVIRATISAGKLRHERTWLPTDPLLDDIPLHELAKDYKVTFDGTSPGGIIVFDGNESFALSNSGPNGELFAYVAPSQPRPFVFSTICGFEDEFVLDRLNETSTFAVETHPEFGQLIVCTTPHVDGLITHELAVCPELGYAVVRQMLYGGDHVINAERHRDFVLVGDGIHVPRSIVRESYRGGTLRTVEEILIIEGPVLGQTIAPEVFTPVEAEKVVDLEKYFQSLSPPPPVAAIPTRVEVSQRMKWLLYLNLIALIAFGAWLLWRPGRGVGSSPSVLSE